ncbi:cytochrome P450 4V2-like isoform X4 [Watersipora subatra]|uniref:cytochrome P450 4V2-like isoform X4 n=1 Tax=Watersipora subatra TaxID=2589382 RepID=UPI00355BDB87
MRLDTMSVLPNIVTWIPWTLTAAITSLIACYLLWKTTRNKRLIDQIPGYVDWPLLGDILQMPQEAEGFMKTLSAEIEKVRDKGLFKVKFFEWPWIVLFSHSNAEKLLSSNKHIDKSWEYYPLHPWLGRGLLTSSGDAWRARRHMLTPSFHFSILKDFLEPINDHADLLVDKLRRERCDTGEQFDIFIPITFSTLDVICSTAMGVDMGALDNTGSEYVTALLLIKEATEKRPRNLFYSIDFIYNRTSIGRKCNESIRLVHEFADKVIKERRALKEAGESNSHSKRRPFLDLLLDCRDEHGNPLTHKEIREEVDTFMFEGHDTTTSAISFTIYMLGAHQDVQKKCQAELDEIIGSSTSISNADLAKMTYLEWCIKETMRIFPTVPFFARELHEEATFGDYSVPKGTTVYLYSMGLHKDPAVFPEPEKFDPTRFSPENCLKRSPFAYVPFSAGPRNCIGQKFAMMELKVILAKMLTTFNIESVVKQADLRVQAALVLQPCDGIKIKLTSRN